MIWNVLKTLQNTVQSPEKVVKKKRSQADEVGKLKYLLQQDKEIKAELSEIKLMLRTILAGLEPSFNFKQPLIEQVACKDDIDRTILQLLFEAGGYGLLPKDLAKKLSNFKVARHQVSRRILRMNRRSEEAFGKVVAEQCGYHWTLTSFAVKAWGETII